MLVLTRSYRPSASCVDSTNRHRTFGVEECLDWLGPRVLLAELGWSIALAIDLASNAQSNESSHIMSELVRSYQILLI